MTGPTHLVAGIASLALPATVAGIVGFPLPIEAVGAAAVGALLGSLVPDLDAPASLLSSFTVPLDTAPSRRRRENSMEMTPFALPATMLHGALGHRTLYRTLIRFDTVRDR